MRFQVSRFQHLLRVESIHLLDTWLVNHYVFSLKQPSIKSFLAVHSNQLKKKIDISFYTASLTHIALTHKDNGRPQKSQQYLSSVHYCTVHVNVAFVYLCVCVCVY